MCAGSNGETDNSHSDDDDVAASQEAPASSSSDIPQAKQTCPSISSPRLVFV